MSWFEQAISNTRYHLTQLHRLAELKLERSNPLARTEQGEVTLNRTPGTIEVLFLTLSRKGGHIHV